MRKPSHLEWNGKTVLAVYDGMNDANRAAIASEHYDQLHLFYGDWEDLSCFDEVAGKINRLSVSNYGKCDLAGLQKLKNLTYLRLDNIGPALPKQTLDFSAFTALEECEVSWRKEYSLNLFDCPELRKLTIWKYPAKKLEELGRASQLKELDLSQSPVVDLSGLDALLSLKKLSLDALRNLQDISALERLPSLRSLSIAKCPSLEDLSIVTALDRLERFFYTGKKPLDDLDFMSALPQLQEFIFNCEVIRQDFRPVFGLRHLQSGRFIALRNFIASDEELHALASQHGRLLQLEVLGQGRKEQTVSFEFRAPA
jgi:hypothetical protein